MKRYPRQPYDAMILHSIGKLFVVAMTIAVSISGLKAFSISHLDAQIPASSDPTKFSLTVEEGNPSGNYAAGTQVTVSANGQRRSPVCGLEGGHRNLGEPIFTHDDRDDSFYGGDDHRNLHCTRNEFPSMRTQLHAD